MNSVYWQAALAAFLFGTAWGSGLALTFLVVIGAFSYSFWILLDVLNMGFHLTALVSLGLGLGLGFPYTLVFLTYTYDAYQAMFPERP